MATEAIRSNLLDFVFGEEVLERLTIGSDSKRGTDLKVGASLWFGAETGVWGADWDIAMRFIVLDVGSLSMDFMDFMFSR